MSKSQAFYNENDPAAAAMLRSLIAAGQITPGIVDERSIEDVRPDELAGYAQCHFFAGYGIWSLALRQAGIPDDCRVWSMSCPCQPFSAAGKGEGFADVRHLWPAAYHLISQCRPERVVGEQVASKNTDPWIDLVQVDLEALGYAFGVCPFPASCVGAPHIRDRAYWVADTECTHHRSQIDTADHGQSQTDRPADRACGCGGASCGVGNTSGTGLAQRVRDAGIFSGQAGGVKGQAVERAGVHAIGLADTKGSGRSGQLLRTGPGVPSDGIAQDFDSCGLADTADISARKERLLGIREQRLHAESGCRDGYARDSEWAESPAALATRPGPVNGFWSDADWLYCRDGKWRPVEPKSEPLAHGMPRSMGAMSSELRGLAELAGLSGDSLKRAKQYRVQQLKGYGNAINAQAATVFIEALS